MLMSLGSFVFELPKIAYDTLTQNLNWRFAKTEMFQSRQATQYLGIGEEAIELTGTAFAAAGNDYSAFDEISALAKAGDSYPLLDGTGKLWGQFFIEKLQKTNTYFLPDGTPQKIEFSLSITRSDDGQPDAIATDNTGVQNA